MSEYTNRYPVNGSSALNVYEPAPAETRIIDFPKRAGRPLHADPNQDLSLLDEPQTLREAISARLWEGPMMSSLRYGSCAGQSTGRMTSLQAGAAALGFFVFFMGTLLFV